MARCLDKRVLAGLAVVAVLGFVVVPRLAIVTLPVLIGLACPLSMLVMMRGTGASRRRSMDAVESPDAVPSPAERSAELARLREEVTTLQAGLRAGDASAGGPDVAPAAVDRIGKGRA